MTRPLFIKMRWSNELKISDAGWWMVNKTEAPALATFFKTWQSCTALKESKPIIDTKY
jgi:hypothetical protein